MLLAFEEAIQALEVKPCAQNDEKRYTSGGEGLRALLEGGASTTVTDRKRAASASAFAAASSALRRCQ